MKFKQREPAKIETQMAPMIDVVFQLLIFFMLTLKIVEPEGDFNINMPIGAPAQQNPEMQTTTIKVRLKADANGGLNSLVYGANNDLGRGKQAIEALNLAMTKIGGMNLGPQQEQEVEIDADYELDYEWVIATIGAVTGRMQDGKVIRLIEKVKFAPPRQPRS